MLSSVYSIDIAKKANVVKLNNIEEIKKLDRNNLKYQVLERRLLIDSTKFGEKIYIQYKGKESEFKGDKCRPWDFRPKMCNANGWIKDLSFPDIWDDLTQINCKSPDQLGILASVFYRIAFMVDYEKIEKDTIYEDIDINTGEIVDSGKIHISLYLPNFTDEFYEYLDSTFGKPRGFSFMSYILYNDLLVLNEDCKYFYRDVELKDIVWDTKVGRRNTMLSHLSVILYLQDKITFSQIMRRFQSGFGVAPCKISEIPLVTNGIIKVV